MRNLKRLEMLTVQRRFLGRTLPIDGGKPLS